MLRYCCTPSLKEERTNIYTLIHLLELTLLYIENITQLEYKYISVCYIYN